MTRDYQFDDFDTTLDDHAASLELEYHASDDMAQTAAEFWGLTDWSGLDGPVSAGLGQAASVGWLSVPQSWATVNQAVVGTPPSWPMGYLTAAAQAEESQLVYGVPVDNGYGMPVDNMNATPRNPYDV